jgi:hypothetical protein
MCSGCRCRIRRVLGYKGRGRQKRQEMVRLLSGSNLAHFSRSVRHTTLPRLGILASCSSQPRDILSILMSSASPLRPHCAISCSSHSCPRLPLKIPPRYPNIRNNLTCLLLSSSHPRTCRHRTSSYPQTTPNPASMYSSFPSQVELISPNRRQILFLTSASSGTCEKWRFEYAI